MGDFELNKPGYYTPQLVSENDFLNDKLTTDQYGMWYSVKFEGDADTYLWMAKTAPEAGKKYYGQIEKTSSGKSVKFKKLKEEDAPRTSSAPSNNTPTNSGHSQSTDESIARSVALKAAVEFATGDVDTGYVLGVADEFLVWLKGGTVDSTPQSGYADNVKKEEPAITDKDMGEPIDLADIPF